VFELTLFKFLFHFSSDHSRSAQHPIVILLTKFRGINRQQVGRAQHGPTYNGPIYLYSLSILNGRAQQTFSRAYTLLGPPGIYKVEYCK